MKNLFITLLVICTVIFLILLKTDAVVTFKELNTIEEAYIFAKSCGMDIKKVVIETPYLIVFITDPKTFSKEKAKGELLNQLKKSLLLRRTFVSNITNYDEYFYPAIRIYLYESIVSYYAIKGSLSYLDNSDKVVGAFQTTANIFSLLCAKYRKEVKNILVSFREDPIAFVIKPAHFPLNIRDNLRNFMLIILNSEGVKEEADNKRIRKIIKILKKYPYTMEFSLMLNGYKGIPAGSDICGVFYFEEDTYISPF